MTERCRTCGCWKDPVNGVCCCPDVLLSVVERLQAECERLRAEVERLQAAFNDRCGPCFHRDLARILGDESKTSDLDWQGNRVRQFRAGLQTIGDALDGLAWAGDSVTAKVRLAFCIETAEEALAGLDKRKDGA